MKRDPEKTVGIVYRAINTLNGNFYIGVTCSSLKKRMGEHINAAKRNNGGCKIFCNAIRKYGEDIFLWEEIKRFDNYFDALDFEKEQIINLKPEYNMTIGGWGVFGLERTKEWQEKIANSNRGRKCSDATKKRMSEIANERKEEWKKYSHLGPKAFSRKVICLTDGKIFESATAAARYYDECKSAIIELCLGQRGRKTVGKKVFKYLEPK